MTEKKNAEGSSAAGQGTINKMEAVRRAIKALGPDAKRGDIQNYIWDEFEIDMGLDHISSYKGDIARKEAKASESGAKAEPSRPASAKKEAPARAAEPAESAGDNGSGGISLEAILATKELLGKVGAAHLKDLIDVLAK